MLRPRLKQLCLIAFAGPLLSSLCQAMEFGAEGGLAYGIGPMGGAGVSVASRMTQTLMLHGFPHAKFSALLAGRLIQINPGILGEYAETRQIANPANFSQTDARGNGYLLGTGVSAHQGAASLLLGIHFFGSYTTPNPLPGLSDVTYSRAAGFLIEAAYDLFPRFAVELRFRGTTYGHSHSLDSTGADVDIDLDPTFNQNLIAVGTRISF